MAMATIWYYMATKWYFLVFHLRRIFIKYLNILSEKRNAVMQSNSASVNVDISCLGCGDMLRENWTARNLRPLIGQFTLSDENGFFHHTVAQSF